MREECAICRGDGPLFLSEILKHVEDLKSTFIVAVHGEGLPDDPAPTPPMAYTIGMWRNFGAPEICIFGVPEHTAGRILNNVRDLVRGGVVLHANKRLQGIAKEYDTVFTEIRGEDEVFKFARIYYRDHGQPDDLKFPRMQLVWPDEKNVFPWEKGFNEKFQIYQPQIGEWPKEE